jgi:hypothetical protein
MEMPDIFLAAQQGPAVDCRFIWRRWVCGDSDTTPSINVSHPRKIRTSLRCNNHSLLVLNKKTIKTKLQVRNLCITQGTVNEKYAEGVTEGVYITYVYSPEGM